ncbi:MAG: tRNA (adenosine(37)-N6)-threonylcarbamoyltransferase complex ATPase subunit type 1 TsaE [Proteobacteria bacterium]|nr:tRNA (adenosine(37)-N6)-threonylcarbamoyltransferase complex ATPase subunit type 1 TsaE [Pseudomonadota bacterium]
MRLRCADAARTARVGEYLAQVRPGDAALRVLYLRGDLGAGKTTFAAGFLRGLGVTGPVRSPSYALMEIHPAGDLTALHIDLYRLHSPEETETLGLRDWARPGCIWLIEWPERGAGHLPPPDLLLDFKAGEAAHEIALQAGTQAPYVSASHTERAAQEWLDRLADLPP